VTERIFDEVQEVGRRLIERHTSHPLREAAKDGAPGRFRLVQEGGSRFREKSTLATHLSDDETVAKMGHPVLCVPFRFVFFIFL
jgi:hypothetical protein